MAKKKKKNKTISYYESEREAGHIISYEESEKQKLAKQRKDRWGQEASARQKEADERQRAWEQGEEDYWNRARKLGITSETDNSKLYGYRPDWKQMAQSRGYDPTGYSAWDTYAKKMAMETPGERQHTWQYEELEPIARKNTETWQKTTADLTHGYEGVFNPQSGKNFDLYDSQGHTVPFNAYALKQAGIPAQRTGKLANDLYNQYVLNRNKPALTPAYSLDYGSIGSDRTDEVKNALSLDTIRKRNDKEQQDIALGRYKGTGNYYKYNKKDLQSAYLKNQMDYVANLSVLSGNKVQKEKAKSWTPDQAYQSAEDLYDTLENSGLVLLNGGRDEARMNAANFYQTKVLQSSKPQDEASRQAAREQLFNELYGNTSGYDYSYLEGSGYKEEVDRQLDQMLDQMYQDYSGEIWQATPQYDSAVRYAKGEMDVIKQQLKNVKEYDELIAGAKAQGLTDTEYHPEMDNGITIEMKTLNKGNAEDKLLFGADDIYSFINGGKSYKAWMEQVGDEIPDSYFNYASMMTTDEVALFNAYYNAGRKTDALAFYEGLMTVLSQRYMYPEEIKRREMAKRDPVGSTVRTFLDTVMQPGEFAAQWIGRAMGDKQTENYASSYYAASRDKLHTRQYIGEDMSGVGKFFYDTGMSAGDSFINICLAGGNVAGLSKRTTQAITLSFFGTQAFQSSMEQNLEQTHGNYELSAAGAAVDALIEIGTEIASIETLLSDPTNMFTYIAKNMVSEGSEEFVGAYFGPYIKQMILHKNEWVDRADQIWHDKGFYQDGEWIPVKTHDEATRQAMKEWNHDILISTASGALSTGGSVFYGGMQNINSKLQMGKQIQNERNTQKGVSGLRQIVDLGIKMEDGGKSHDMALKMQQDMDAGKKVSNYQAGQLAQTIMEETGEKQNDVIRETMERDVQKQLEDTGVDRGQAREYAGLIARDLLGGEKLSISERHKLSKDSRAIDVWKSFYTNPALVNQAESNISTATEETRKTMRSVSDLLSDRNAATSTVAAEVTRSIRETKSDSEAIDNLQQRRGDILSNEYAQEMKTVLQEDEQAQKSKSFVDDAMKIRMAVMSQSETMPATNLSQETATRLQEAAQKEWDAGEKLRLENNRQLKVTPGKGTAVIAERQADGSFKTLSEYGKDGFQQQLKDMGLSKKTRNRATVISEVAKRMGMNARFINEEQNKNIHGYEIQQTGEIVINLASDLNDNNKGKHMLSTLAHEMTHWLEQNSNEAYKELRKYVLNNLRAKGQNVEQLLLKAMDAQRGARILQEEMNNGKSNIQDLSLNDAMFEIVAKSCENLLSSKEFEQELARSNPTLHGKIVQAVREFMGRLKSAIEGMDKSLSKEAWTLYNETEEIAKIWLKGYHEATGQEQTEESDMPDWSQETDKSEEMPDWSEEGIYQPAEGVKLSVEDTSYMKAINSGNIEAANRIVRAIAKTKGYIERAFHGTNAFGFTEVDMNESQGQFFVAYNLDLAGTYTHMQSLKNISENKIETMSNKELARLAEAVSIEAEEGVTAVRYNEKTGLFEADMDIGETAAYTKEEIQAMLNDYIEYDQTVEEGKKSNALKTMKQGIYDLYLNPGKQLVIDAEGRSWRNIPFNLEDYGTSWEQEFGSMPKPGGWTTRTIAEWAKRAGYDSVRINNVVDNGNQSSYKGGGDIGIFFNENAIKSADTVTVDNEGNVIPPSERFNAEKTDIRYSVQDMEAKSWEEQIDLIEKKIANKDDVMVITKDGEMTNYGIDGLIVIKQSDFRKARRQKGDNNRSAHGISLETMKKLPDAIKNPAAKIVTNRGTVLVTELKDDNKNYIIVPIQRTTKYGIKAWESTTIYGRTRMSTLFGNFVDGNFELDKNAKITLYKENAIDILKTGSEQYGAQQNVIDAINKIAQNETESKNKDRYSVEEMDQAYDQAGNLIPLSKRLDINNPSVKYSLAELEQRYTTWCSTCCRTRC